MINPERKPVDMGKLKEINESAKENIENPPTNLQKDHKKIVQLMNGLENPAPGMDKKLAQDKERLYAQFDVPKGASMETVKLAYGQAVAAEKAMNASETAREAFKDVGVESPHHIARVAIEFNVLADEVGDIKEAKLSKVDMSEEAKTKISRFDKIDAEWEEITAVIQEYVTERTALGDLQYNAKTAKVVRKRTQGEKPLPGITPQR